MYGGTYLVTNYDTLFKGQVEQKTQYHVTQWENNTKYYRTTENAEGK